MARERSTHSGSEPIFEAEPTTGSPQSEGRRAAPASPSAAAAVGLISAVLVALVLISWIFGGDAPADAEPPPGETDPGPEPPSRETALTALDEMGGVDALVIATAEGAFDMVTFDPVDADHLLASQRASYGVAENEDVNEEWFVENGEVAQRLYAADRPHDFAHFNNDGSVAVWTNSGNKSGFASRIVAVESERGSVVSGPVYASRSVVVAATLFALTGDEDYYSTARVFDLLIADRAGVRTVLDSGSTWSWVDSPMPDVVVAYPADAAGVTAVWDSRSLAPLPGHPLAGHAYQRLAVSADGRRAVGLLWSGVMEVFDPATGATSDRFGSVNPNGIAQPVTLSRDGTSAVTVDRDGTVGIWWVGSDLPLALIEGDAASGRFIAEHRGARTSSAVSADARRVAVRVLATPEAPTEWRIIDTDVESWLEQSGDKP